MKFVNAIASAFVFTFASVTISASASALAAAVTTTAAAAAAVTRLQFRVPFGGYFWGKVANATPLRARKIPSKS